MNSHTEQGQHWLEQLLGLAGFPAAVKLSPSPFPEDAESSWLVIQDSYLTAEQTDCLLGEQGQVLDALQYLVNATHNLGQDRQTQSAFTVELAGYRSDRYQQLQLLADQAAAQVRETSSEYEMQPLTAMERRLVHTLFKSSPDLETYSRGQEPDRRLVVRLRQSESEPSELGN